MIKNIIETHEDTTIINKIEADIIIDEHIDQDLDQDIIQRVEVEVDKIRQDNRMIGDTILEVDQEIKGKYHFTMVIEHPRKSTDIHQEKTSIHQKEKHNTKIKAIKVVKNHTKTITIEGDVDNVGIDIVKTEYVQLHRKRKINMAPKSKSKRTSNTSNSIKNHVR